MTNAKEMADWFHKHHSAEISERTQECLKGIREAQGVISQAKSLNRELSPELLKYLEEVPARLIPSPDIWAPNGVSKNSALTLELRVPSMGGSNDQYILGYFTLDSRPGDRLKKETRVGWDPLVKNIVVAEGDVRAVYWPVKADNSKAVMSSRMEIVEEDRFVKTVKPIAQALTRTSYMLMNPNNQKFQGPFGPGIGAFVTMGSADSFAGVSATDVGSINVVAGKSSGYSTKSARAEQATRYFSPITEVKVVKKDGKWVPMDEKERITIRDNISSRHFRASKPQWVSNHIMFPSNTGYRTRIDNPARRYMTFIDRVGVPIYCKMLGEDNAVDPEVFWKFMTVQAIRLKILKLTCDEINPSGLCADSSCVLSRTNSANEPYNCKRHMWDLDASAYIKFTD